MSRSDAWQSRFRGDEKARIKVNSSEPIIMRDNYVIPNIRPDLNPGWSGAMTQIVTVGQIRNRKVNRGAPPRGAQSQVMKGSVPKAGGYVKLDNSAKRTATGGRVGR